MLYTYYYNIENNLIDINIIKCRIIRKLKKYRVMVL